MKKHLLPCLAALFLLLTACGVGHMGVHALEDITDADIVANEMGYSAVLWQSYSDTFSCEASWESFRGVEYLWTLPGNEARTVHVTYAEPGSAATTGWCWYCPTTLWWSWRRGRTRWRCRRGAPGWPWPPPGAVGPSPPNGNHKYP